MKIKHVGASLVILFVLLSVSSCNRVDKDAKKSAKYTNQSIKQAQELDFEKAKDSYHKAENIKQKYVDNNKKTVKFNDLYKKYRDQGKLIKKSE